ncbi:flavodoxin domain-containing protein [Hoeflea poritis]|uniref:Protoporphyrinogen oxidase n=1 Tax=Hoeflea poritis TaxID=2993659 RepID=A0ABT4VI50_9HYPH|nr:flavodoxin domain-containing protein [Hoeflea poritis]MDA4844284.1 protoporphyrinogen oxidase [Hoeflea poritis]
MRFLLIYGTTEGQTRKIAEYCAERLKQAGHEVDIGDSRRRMLDLVIPSYDAVILAGSVHQQTHQETLLNFTVAHRKQLKELPTLLISVSLSIAFENGAEEARRYVDRFIEDTGFEPRAIALAAGALKYDQYDYYMNQIVEHVVLENRAPITEDREFTDWDALGKELDAFVQSCQS